MRVLKGILVRNIGWKLLSLTLALVLWIVVAREPELHASISIPIEFKNLPEELDISSTVPDRIHVEIRGPAGRLSRDYLADLALVLDLLRVSFLGRAGGQMQAACIRRVIRKPIVPKIAPVGVVGLDHRELPFPLPLLDQLFAGDCGFDLLVPLGVYQAGLAVVFDVLRTLPFAVLVNATDQVCGYADIQTAAVAVRHDVNPAAFLHRWVMVERRAEGKRDPVSSTGRRKVGGE